MVSQSLAVWTDDAIPVDSIPAGGIHEGNGAIVFQEGSTLTEDERHPHIVYPTTSRLNSLFDRSVFLIQTPLRHPLHFKNLFSWLAALCRTHQLNPLPRPITNKLCALCNDVKKIEGQSISVIKGCSLTHGKRINLRDNFVSSSKVL